ncbi:MAG: SIS domain-containing protein, partial [Planctomycetota bacterium]
MLGVHLDVEDYVKRLQAELDRLDRAEMTGLADAIYEAWENQRFVFIFGNGGSATLASHLAEDLGKGCLREADLKDETKKRIKVISLTDNVGWLTAVGNDCGYDQIFVQQLMNYGGPG